MRTNYKQPNGQQQLHMRNDNHKQPDGQQQLLVRVIVYRKDDYHTHELQTAQRSTNGDTCEMIAYLEG
jgi:hypothetical protein